MKDYKDMLVEVILENHKLELENERLKKELKHSEDCLKVALNDFDKENEKVCKTLKVLDELLSLAKIEDKYIRYDYSTVDLLELERVLKGE